MTLNVDGHIEHVTATGDTVGRRPRRTRASPCGSHDEVAPAVDQPVNDGTTIAVRYGKPLQLDVDGDTSTYWVTATDVRGALQRDRPQLRPGPPVGEPRRGHHPRRPADHRSRRRSGSRS